MNRKPRKLPFQLRLVRWTFPILERVSPKLAEKLAVRLFFKPFRLPYPEYEKPYLDKAEKIITDVNSKKVTVYSYGEGTPVILVHGWSGRATQFWKFTDLFTKYGFRVLTFDAPGHGYSDGGTTNVIEFADVITELANSFNAQTVIGHSLGGVASLLSASHGAPIKNILMINSPTQSDYLLREFLERINGTEKSGQGVLRYVQNLTDKSFDDFASVNLVKNLDNVKIQIIHDENDQEVPFHHALALKKEFPSAKLIKTRGLGHSRILSNDRVVSESLAFAYRS